MSLTCALAGHRPSERTIRNGGYHFSTCERCKTDLVEDEAGWAKPPPGFRIVWRTASDAPPETLSASSAPEWETVKHVAPDPEERRSRRDRRQARGELPQFLRGKDRRRARDRRKGFGKRAEPLRG